MRSGEEARLCSVEPRGGDWSQGWVEEWVCDGSGDVISFTRHSPTRTGWRLVALGTQHEGQGLDSVMKVAELWAQGEVSREAGMVMSNMVNAAGWQWLI